MRMHLYRLVPALPKKTLPRLLRHCSDTPGCSPLPHQSESVVTQAVQLLQGPEETWIAGELSDLLFQTESPPSPQSLHHITRRLGSSAKALKFLEFVKTNSPPDQAPSLLSFVFQAVLELGSCESGSENGLRDLYEMARESRISLTANAATHLLRHFGRAGMIDELVSVFQYVDSNWDVKKRHVYNVYVSELLKLGRVGDALKVLDKMLDPDFKCPPSDLTGDIVFSSLLRRNDSRGADVSDEEIADLMLKFGKYGIFPDSIKISRFISKLCRNGKTGKAWDILQGLFVSGCHIEAHVCNSILTGLSKERDIGGMNEVVAKMKEMNVEPNVVTFGILINQLCKSGRLDHALEVLDKMCRGDIGGVSVNPDVVIYNTIINGLCKVGRQDEGLGLVEKMKLQGCLPNTVTYSSLMDGYCKSGEIEQARELFDQMSMKGIPPNEITISILVDGMCRHGRIGTALQTLREMKGKGLIPKANSYTSLISAFCGVNNIGKAMELFDEMSASGISPDAIVYYTLISGLVQAGMVDDASSMAVKLKEAGFSLDSRCYNIMISGFCKKNKVEKVIEMLEDMEEAKVEADVVTYNTIISYFSRIGDFEIAHKWLAQMIDNGFSPTVVTYGALINAYCINRNVDGAMKIFRNMESTSRVPPNTVIYNILISAACMEDRLELAWSLMDDMIVRGLKPQTNTFNAMLKVLKEKNLLDKGFWLMDQMTELACKPDYITMEILTEWLSTVDELKKLEMFLQGYEVSTLKAEEVQI